MLLCCFVFLLYHRNVFLNHNQAHSARLDMVIKLLSIWICPMIGSQLFGLDKNSGSTQTNSNTKLGIS